MIEKLYKRASKACDEVELYLEESEASSCSAESGKLNSFSRGTESGYGIRAVKNRKVGFASGNSLDDFGKVLKRALALSKFGNRFYGFPARSKYKAVRGIFFRSVEKLDDDFLYKKTEAMVKALKKLGARPTAAGVSKGVMRFSIANSNGVLVEEKGTDVGCSAVARVGKVIAHESEEKTSEKLGFEKVAEAAARLALACKGKRRPPKGRMKVLLEPRAASELLTSTLLPSFSGENVWRRTSRLAGKIGEKLFSSRFSIRDSGILPSGIGSSKCDREGTPSRETWLVKKGKVAGFLYNHESSVRAGCRSTGNGYRGYGSTPSISQTNILFSRGKEKREALLSSMKRGILVSGLSGTHTVSPFSGDFSLEAKNSFLVEGGKVKYAVDSCMVSGNIFSVLKDAELSQEQRTLGDTKIGSILSELDVSA